MDFRLESFKFLDFSGATRRNRTDDLLITNPIQDNEEPED